MPESVFPGGGLLLGGVCSRGVSAPGLSAPGGCLLWGSALGGLLQGVCSGGSAPGGVCSQGVSAPGGVWYPSMHWGRHPPLLWTEWQTGLKYYLGHKNSLRPVIKDGCQRRLHRFHVSQPPTCPGRWICYCVKRVGTHPHPDYWDSLCEALSAMYCYSSSLHWSPPINTLKLLLVKTIGMLLFGLIVFTNNVQLINCFRSLCPQIPKLYCITDSQIVHGSKCPQLIIGTKSVWGKWNNVR